MAIYRGTGGANEATDLATNQAVIAKQFAEDAANSATQANLTLDTFQDIYLGAFATAPMLDNDGSALQIGALYFSTTANKLFIYASVGWQETATASPASFVRNSFTGNGVQTTFVLTTPPASNESILVYANGVYTTNYSLAGTSLTITPAPANGVSIVALIATTVAANMLGNDSVFTAAIQNNAVTSQKIADGAITTTQLADNSVTTAKVVDANITSAKIADLNVTTAKINDNAVTTVKVANSNITSAKLEDNISFPGLGAVKVPAGTTAQRPGTPRTGDIRFNNDLVSFEGYTGTNWSSVGGGATGGSVDKIFYLNDQTVNTSYTIPTGQNAMTTGPLTIANGVTITVPDNSNLVIL